MNRSTTGSSGFDRSSIGFGFDESDRGNFALTNDGRKGCAFAELPNCREQVTDHLGRVAGNSERAFGGVVPGDGHFVDGVTKTTSEEKGFDIEHEAIDGKAGEDSICSIGTEGLKATLCVGEIWKRKQLGEHGGGIAQEAADGMLLADDVAASSATRSDDDGCSLLCELGDTGEIVDACGIIGIEENAPGAGRSHHATGDAVALASILNVAQEVHISAAGLNNAGGGIATSIIDDDDFVTKV